MNEEILIALSSKTLKTLTYQEVTKEINGKNYLQTLNVILAGKTIKKLRFSEKEVVYENGIGEKLITQLLLEQLKTDNKKSTNLKTRRRRSKVNNNAAKKAASDILKDMGL